MGLVLLLASAMLSLLGGCRSPSPLLRARDLEGDAVDLLEPAPVGPTVLVFVATDCPISNRYAPTVRALYDQFAGRGIRFFLVYTDPTLSLEAAARHRREFGYPMPALFDEQRRLVEWTGAAVTPEAAILDPRGRVLYLGRIDDRYTDYGRYRELAARQDLRLALTAIVAGEPVPSPASPAIGCYIPPLALANSHAHDPGDGHDAITPSRHQGMTAADVGDDAAGR